MCNIGFQFLFLFSIIFGCLDGVRYNILMMTSPFHDHNIFLDSIGRELALRGHQVTLRCNQDFKMEPLDGLKYETFPNLLTKLKKVNPWSVGHLSRLMEDTEEAVDSMYTDPRITELISQPIDPHTNRSKYDVIIFDEFFQEMYLPLAHHLGIPSISTIAYVRLTAITWNLNIPHPLSYANYIGYSEPMNLLDRTKSVLSNLFYVWYYNYVLSTTLDTQIRKYLPSSPQISELTKNVNFVLSNSHPAIQHRMPYMPYVAEIGCVHCKSAHSLPKYLEDVVQSSGDAGVIYLSKDVELEALTREFGEILLQVLGRLPQTILWENHHHHNHHLNYSSLPSNFYMVKWVPRQDLLAHRKLRLVITNGDLLSTQEAAYHGCPILGLPTSGEHVYALENAKRNGFGEYLEWRATTSQHLSQTIKDMLWNKKYKESALRASVLVKDRQLSPGQEAAYWVEYVIRHRGAHFLKSGYDHMSWHEYFLLDAWPLIILMAAAITTAVCWIYFFLWFFIFFAMDDGRKKY